MFSRLQWCCIFQLIFLDLFVFTADSSFSDKPPKVGSFCIAPSSILNQHFFPSGLTKFGHLKYYLPADNSQDSFPSLFFLWTKKLNICLLNIHPWVSYIFQTKHIQRRTPDIYPLLQICFFWVFTQPQVFCISVTGTLHPVPSQAILGSFISFISPYPLHS